MATVYLLDFVLPSAWPSVLFLFGFMATEFTVDEITFILVPRPLGSPSQYRLMKFAIASYFASSPLSQVLLFREELRPGVTLPPDPVPDSRTAIAIQPPPPLTLFMDYLALLPAHAALPTGIFISDEALPDSDRSSSIFLWRTFPPELHSPMSDS
jgi:hypothetical protein